MYNVFFSFFSRALKSFKILAKVPERLMPWPCHERNSQEDIELAGSGETSFLAPKKMEMGVENTHMCVYVCVFLKCCFRFLLDLFGLKLKIINHS